MDLKPWVLATSLSKPGKDATAKLVLECGKRMPVMTGSAAADLPFVITDFWELSTDEGDYFDVLAVPEKDSKYAGEDTAILTRIPSEFRLFEQYRVKRSEAEEYFAQCKAAEPEEPEEDPAPDQPPAAPAPLPEGWTQGAPQPVNPPTQT